MGKIKALCYTIVSGMMTGVGAFFGAAIGQVSDVMISICLSIAAGAMLYIVSGELIHEANDLYKGKVGFIGNILGFIGDKSWFRIKRQDMYLDEFYNANNRTWQYYLNLTKMYNYSLFANGLVIATDDPDVDVSSMEFVETGTVSAPVEVVVNATKTLHIKTTPFSANFILLDGVRK